MDCRKAKRMIMLDLDGELDRLRKSELADHLKECLRCQRERIVFESISEIFIPPEKIQPSPYFLAKLGKKISSLGETPSPSPFFSRRLVRMGSFLMSLVLFFVFFLVGTSLGSKIDGDGDSDKKLVEAFSQSTDISIFDDIPNESLAHVYDELLMEEE